MKSIMILTLLTFGIVFIQCETNNNETLNIPPEDWIKGVWRSEYNDSIKFISNLKVYMNSILYYYYFENDSVKLRSFCQENLCFERTNPYKAYKYEFDIKENQFIIYDLYETYNFCNICPPCDSIIFFHNPDTITFTKSFEGIHLPFEEWIQGVWVNSKTDNSLLFSRPIQCECVGSFWKGFCDNGIFFGGNGVTSQYVFTKDSLRLLPNTSSSPYSYASYHYELDKENYLLILYNYHNPLDTVKFNKQLDL